MVRTSSRIITTFICCLVLSFGTIAYAGVLDGYGGAYNNGLGPGTGGSWSGVVSYDSGGGLSGSIDWAVIPSSTFNSAFGGLGYVAPDDELVYAFQLTSTGSLEASGMSLLLGGQPAGSGGSFEGAGVTGADILTATANSFIASYSFAEIDGGSTTAGMVYSSPNIPELTGPASVIDGGTPTLATSFLARPGAVSIPEPGSALLACVGMLFMLLGGRGRDR